MEQTRICDGRNSSYYVQTSVKDGITVFSLFSYATTHPFGHFFDGIMKETAMQTASFLRATYCWKSTSTEEKVGPTASSKNVSNVQLTTTDERIVWHSCVLWLTRLGPKHQTIRTSFDDYLSIAITFHFFTFYSFFSMLCVFMFYGLTPEIKMDWIGLDWIVGWF